MVLQAALRNQSRTMKQKVLVLLVLTACAWSPVFSATDTPETRRREAERLSTAQPPEGAVRGRG